MNRRGAEIAGVEFLKIWPVLLAVCVLAPSCAPGDEADRARIETIKSRLVPRIRQSTEFTPTPPVVEIGVEARAEALAKRYVELLRDRYIVVLEDDATLTLGPGAPASVASRHGAVPTHVYKHAIKGFAARLSATQRANLEADPQVRFIQPDGIMYVTTDVPIPTGIDRVDADVNPTANIDTSDDRVDVRVAIIDTGIDLDHGDLDVEGGFDFVSFDGVDTEGDDLHGHGTHCGGTVAAFDDDYDFGPTGYEKAVMGVAPGAKLWAVRVLDENGAGLVSDIIDGINWITGCVNGSDTACALTNAPQIKVANMSLGCECDDTDCWCDDACTGFANCNDALRYAIDTLVLAGVTLVTSAGNDSRDVGDEDTTCHVSPSCYDSPIVVAAMTDFDGKRGSASPCPDNCYYTSNTDDDISSYSNFGAQVDIIAPGTCITSTFHKTGCNDCVLADDQCGFPKVVCVTSPVSYKCCNNSNCNSGCSAEHSCGAGKNGLCYDGDGNVYCCIHGPYTMMSGTSMSSPHVVGGAALFIHEYHRNNGSYPSPDQVKDALTGNGESPPCGSGTGSWCTNLPGVPGLFVGEHRDSIEVSGYTVDDSILDGAGYGYVGTTTTTDYFYDGSQGVEMGVNDSDGGVHGYSMVNFCLSKHDLSDPLYDYFKASAYVRFDAHTDWTGFAISTEDGSDTDVWLYWWWIRADGTVLDELDRFGGASVFGTTSWHLVEITVDRRDPVSSNHTASLTVDTSVEASIPLETIWDWDDEGVGASDFGMRCLSFFSGVTDDTVQDMYVDRVYLRSLPGGTYDPP